jgi:PAS domain S-box-containing protein
MFGNLTRWLFDPTGLTPHGFCLLWDPGLIWMHAIADLVTGLAYLTIPLALAIFVRERRDLRFRPLFLLFAAFIVLCGGGHWLELLTLWVPAYGIEGVVKSVTAIVSMGTAIAVWWLLPHALALPSPAQLRAADAAVIEARHQVSFDHSPVPLYMLDSHGIITAVSNSCATFLGYARVTMVGHHLNEFLSPGSPVWQNAGDHARFVGPNDRTELERRFLCGDGSIVDGLVLARSEQEMMQSCVLIDITSRKRAELALRSSEARLQHGQKMEALGKLAAGVAHDFNNILQTIVGSLELVRDEVEDGTQARAFTEVALTASVRGSSLTRDLLSYARKQVLRPQAIALAEFLSHIRQLLTRTLNPNIVIKLRVEQSPSMLADPGQLQTALLNLAINAAHAMPRGGELTFEAHPDDEAGRSLAVVTVTDTGAGMDEATLAQATDPFFSTKGLGGSGLGLSMVLGFVEQSGGGLRITSQPGKGTRAELRMPAVTSVDLQKMPAQQETRQASGRILLTDDTPDVLITMAALLVKSGFEVVCAENGDRALALLRSGGPFDLLITDYAMPGRNGAELIIDARLIQPGLRTLILTGFADLDFAATPSKETVVLRKPVQRPELIDAVRKVMGHAL